MITLRLHNSLTRSKEPFAPIDPYNVRMYVCGPTVYDLAHLGNARSAVAFDVLHRVLRTLYPRVAYVRNVTDVDDKIIAKARETGEDIASITARTHAAYLEDMGALGVLAPTVEPRATGHIADMQRMIETLIAKGHAYVAAGHVLFSVRSNPRAGILSGHDLKALRAGARVEVAPYKADPADFVLWKPAAEGEPGWESPWGFGRPGWHIECSAMAARHLGEVFDIHGGGHDLLFPHHENEIAQSTCAHGTERMANYWLHNGMLTVDGRKMSKSLGNFLTVREMLSRYPGRAEAIRLVLLSVHYRQTLDFSLARVDEAIQTLNRFYGALKEVPAPVELPEALSGNPVLEALADDLNTPLALSRIHELLDRMKAAPTSDEAARIRGQLLVGGRLLGLLEGDPAAWFSAGDMGDEADIERLVTERAAARKARDFARADAIRAELAARGVILEDTPAGTVWRRA